MAAVIPSAHLLQRMGQSEMRLGLNSTRYGSIELHTSVSQDLVGASIATGHAELRAAMIAEMPSLEQAMAQHQLKLDNFYLGPRSSAQNNDHGASAGNQSLPGRTRSAGSISAFGDDTAATETAPPEAWAAPHSSRLNVHA